MTKQQIDKLLEDKATRKCKKCHSTLPITDFYIWHEKKKNSYSIKHKCKRCMNAERPRGISRDYQLKRRYNISLEDYNKKLKQQGYSCAICRRHMDTVKDSLHVDHCHHTSKVRGLLCYKCNTAIGLFKDNLDNVRRALKYLRSYKV